MPYQKKKLLAPPDTSGKVKATLTFPSPFWEDYLPRLRTFYEGHDIATIIERLVRHAAEKDGFNPKDHDLWASDEPPVAPHAGGGRRRSRLMD